MSSDEDHDAVPVKKRRVQRACDWCRRKKRACDGLRMAEKKCTNCVENGLECTFAGADTRRRSNSYVDALEARLDLAESLLSKESLVRCHANPSHTPLQLAPQSGASASALSPGHSQWSVGVANNSTAIPAGPPAPGPGVELAMLTIRSMNTPAPASHPHDDDIAHIELTRNLQELSLNEHREGFLGKSSGAMLVKAAVLAREGYEERQTPWTARRMHYWTYNPVNERTPHVGPFVFPPPDLLASLVDLYFVNHGIYYPLLHRPTFERSLADGLHERDAAFGAVVLVVCAIGARFSVDERVCPPGAEPLRVGWDFFNQLPLVIDHVFVRPTLYHLQFYCLATIFLAPSTPAACWTLVGIGIRIAQDTGAHRLQNFGPGAKPTVEGELWKRAFWILVCMDRNLSTAYGRPCTTQYESFDAELPVEVDDEYWENEADPSRAFMQPPGKPSRVAYFNCLIRLDNILGFSLHLLYGLNKTKILLAYRDDAWEEHIVAELDSALTRWVDSIPNHLRWDPSRQDDIFFDQSAFLYCSYYGVQMTIHRPFIPAVRPGAPTSLPSLAICTNAARSVTHVVETSRLRKNGTPVPVLLGWTFIAGIVLLLNVWSGKRTGLSPHMNSALFQVHKCMAAIKVCETRWQAAGLFWDLLCELTTVGNMPLPRASASPPAPSDTVSAPAHMHTTHKRARDESDDVHGEPAGPDPRQPAPTNVAPGIAFTAHPPDLDASGIEAGTTHSFASEPAQCAPLSLPTYSADLGRLPVFRQHPQSGAGGSGSGSGGSGLSSTTAWYPDFADDGFAKLFGDDALAFAQGAEAGLGYSAFTVPGPDVTSTAAGKGANAGVSSDEKARWATAPMGIGVDAWGQYFGVMSELFQGLGGADGVPTT